MASTRVYSYLLVIVLVAVGLANGTPAKTASFWKGTPMDSAVEEMRSSCTDSGDSLACMKYKVMSFLDTIFKKDNYQLSDDVEVRHNGNEVSARSNGGSGIVESVERYLESHDVTFDMPMADAKVTVSPRNLNDNELNLKIKFSGRSNVEARKSKLKKIFIPILVFVLLKAMTVIPMALGILGIKAWNALQLSFFSFITSVALAIFQLCKKISGDHHHPHISAHGPWDTRREFPLFATANVDTDEPIAAADAQAVAYNAYA